MNVNVEALNERCEERTRRGRTPAEAAGEVRYGRANKASLDIFWLHDENPEDSRLP